MAEASILDKAIGLIPGVGKAKSPTKRPTTQMQLANLKRNLAKLLSDVEKLSGLIATKQKNSTRRPVAKTTRAPKGKRAPTARKSAKARA